MRCERGCIKQRAKLKCNGIAGEASGNPMGDLKLGHPFMVVPGMGLRNPTHQAALACTLPREGVQP